MTITFDEFVEKYKPIQNPFTQDGSYDNTLFETYGKELELVMETNENLVWTLLSADEEQEFIVTGKRFVNREGFFICSVSWNNEDIEVNCNEMISILDACEHCYKFGLSIDIPLSVNEISDYYQQYKSTHTPGFITIGEAKYRCMELLERYFEDNFMEQTELDDEQQDLIHSYYAQL